MGMKLKLDWYDKDTEVGEGQEYSEDFGNDAFVLESLGVPVDNNINAGGFDVTNEWAKILQPHFKHALDLSRYDYQFSFDYRRIW